MDFAVTYQLEHFILNIFCSVASLFYNGIQNKQKAIATVKQRRHGKNDGLMKFHARLHIDYARHRRTEETKRTETHMDTSIVRNQGIHTVHPYH